jgi:hypothetical protein
VILLPSFNVVHPDVILSFATKIDCESGFDWALVEYERNGDSIWKELAAYSAYNCNWTNLSLQLGEKTRTGDNVRVRFRFKTDEDNVSEGWLLDAIRIFGVPRPKAPSDFVGFDAPYSASSEIYWKDNSSDESRFEVFKESNNQILWMMGENQDSAIVERSKLGPGVRIRSCYGPICSLPSSVLLRNPAPTVQAISPSVGFEKVPGKIQISGSNFSKRVSVELVNAAGKKQTCQVETVGRSRIECAITLVNSGKYSVSIKNPQNSLAAKLRDAYQLKKRLTVSTVLPNSGPMLGGRDIILVGSGLSATNTVFVGEGKCLRVRVNPLGTNLTCSVPASKISGPQTIRVSGADSQEATIQRGFNYLSRW